MARIPYPDPEDFSPETRELVENLPDLKILSMLAHADDSYSQYLLFVGSLLSRTDLDPHLRELVILRVAAKEEAEYQWVQHEGISKEIGIDDEQIEAVRTGDFDSPALLPDAQALLRFTDQVLARPAADEEVFEALRESFPPRQIVEVLLLIGNYRLLANFQTQLDLEIDDPVTPADYGHPEE